MIGWLLSEAGEVPPGEVWLTPREREVFASLRSAKRQSDWRLGRWVAKSVVASALHVPVERVEVLAAADGAPEARLVEESSPALSPPVTVSLSHRDGRSLAVVAQPAQRIGCDLELVERRPAGFAAEWFADSELITVTTSPPSERDAVITMIWSAKESALKALRCGLRRPTRSVVVTTTAQLSDAWQGLRIWDADGERELGGWGRVEKGFVLTIVAELDTQVTRITGHRSAS